MSPPPLAHLLPGRKINDHGGGLVNPSEALGQIAAPQHKGGLTWQSSVTCITRLSLVTGFGWKGSTQVSKDEVIRTGGKMAPTPPKRLAPESSPSGDIVKRAKHMGSSELLQRLIGPRSLAVNAGWEGGGTKGKDGKNGGGGGGGSVLMNLLVSGCDVSAGYVCMPTVKTTKTISSSRAMSRASL